MVRRRIQSTVEMSVELDPVSIEHLTPEIPSLIRIRVRVFLQVAGDEESHSVSSTPFPNLKREVYVKLIQAQPARVKQKS